MNKSEFTRWFYGAHEKPVRTGLYQVFWFDRIEWCWYTVGKGWGWCYQNKRWAMQKQWMSIEGATQSKIWRGVNHG